MTGLSQFTIDRVLGDTRLLGAALGDPVSWRTWLVCLKAAFGLPLNDAERNAFASVAGGRSPPSQRVREFWAIIGRRGGKSRMAAALAVFIACFVSHQLAAGEIGYVLVLAMSRDQASVVLDYVKGFLNASPVLRQEIDTITAAEIRLKNGVVIAIHANSFRSIRGRTLLACIFDEVSMWRDEASATPDLEVYRAVRPALKTTKGMLIGISTPYRKIGLLHQKHRDHYGQPSDEVLVVQGPSTAFNLTLTQSEIDAEVAADPEGATSEWEGTFRTDISSYLDDQLIDAAVEHGRPLELPPVLGSYRFYKAHTDASGGTGRDSYTICIGHKEKNLFVIDAVRGTTGGFKFDPQEVTKQYAALLKEYGVSEVTGDNYAAEWVASAWSNTGVIYVRSDAVKSQIYLNVIPLFTRGLVRLPDHAKLLRELRLLERQLHRGGKESVDHPRGGHDDHANSVCGVLHGLSLRFGYDLRGFQPGYVDWDRPAPAQVSAADQNLRNIYQNINNAIAWGIIR